MRTWCVALALVGLALAAFPVVADDVGVGHKERAAATNSAPAGEQKSDEHKTTAASRASHDHAAHGDSQAGHGHSSSHAPWEPPSYSVLGFAVLLLGIAVFPLVHRTAHWWEHNPNKAKFTALVAAPVFAYVLYSDWHRLLHVGWEYVQFVSLLGALFVVAGGIHLRGTFRPTPTINTMFLGVGFVLASFIGTTGASMLMIYPLLLANNGRSHKVHTIVFCILAVSNLGGLLTPLGDPPLFLGFLKGIDFWWWTRLWWVWLAAGAYLLTLYYAIESYYFRREDPRHLTPAGNGRESIWLMGAGNTLLLACIVAATVLAPSLDLARPLGWDNVPTRELCYLAIAVVSLLYSRVVAEAADARQRNNFSFVPINEVAILFAGIFVTMIPALQMLELHGGELGVSQPWQYFLATGVFSSVLDNAPTFVIFSELGRATDGLADLRAFSTHSPRLLAAVSLGAVFMGANTYVGNAPNFMVKATAESQGVRMPSFFAYAAVAVVLLTPVYAFVVFVLPLM